ncbi:LLM class flavin-dependent oxidoreductase [Staphylococcus rostri]|uniref:LLM class flavin-dependent oxidoreductase n=1 Tax=Staphylococcus rostri TaxID=522262 RepID=A0A2K3YVW6_9STAP|nr:LLM class flavin-dependent oxidoreductase [Staphylococcus rostri]PNZ29358.1 LLM class flavin-dependent oxidoreductase [Staphylococcus rostri]
MKKPILSVLDIVNVYENENLDMVFKNFRQRAAAIDKLGYHRYWISEHHNMASIASSATVVLIKDVLEHTKQLRVGSGGIMMPNHSPLVVAEQFGTLATFYPDRVDLGLGRAPGTDQMTSYALRRHTHQHADTFHDDIKALLQYFGPESQQGKVKAIPGAGTEVPIYVLGSSINSAVLAAELGLPYAFAAHFAPAQLKDAIQLYRTNFKPSQYLTEPYVMIAVNAIAADTNSQADYLYTSQLQNIVAFLTGHVHPVPQPKEDYYEFLGEDRVKQIQSQMGIVIKGDKKAVQQQIIDLQEIYEADELIITTTAYGIKNQINSFKIVKDAVDSI